MRSYRPEEFLSKLSVNELPDPTEVTIFGLARSNDDSSSVIHFSNSPSCENWLTIPIGIIESIDHLKTITCKDHQHPLVKIKFKQPEEARQDVAFFLNLLSQMQNSLTRALSAARAVPTSKVSPKECTEDCTYVNTPEGLTVCCWCPDNEVICTGIV